MDRTSFLRRLGKELGVITLFNSGRDVYMLLVTRFLRMFAYGSSTLILALFFAELGHSDTKIGLFMTLTLVGDVLISLALTFVADAIGRRNILILGSLLMTLSGSVFATVANYWVLLLAAVVGVISPSGNEIGPFRAVEESTLAQLSEPSTRSDIFAWYVVIGTLGTALGSLGGGWLTQYLEGAGWRTITAYKFVFWIYAIIGLVKAMVSLLLSRRCEAQPPPASSRSDEGGRGEESEEEQPFLPNQGPSGNAPQPPPTQTTKTKKSAFSQISRESRATLMKLCGLFFFDSLASGMVPNSLIAFFMDRKFGMREGTLGSIMSAAQFMSSIGNIFASSVAKRIGLVRAMVYTHLPSAILLAMVPAPPSLILTVIILVLRASLASMDQAPRSAFLSAVVLPEERTATMGIVNTVKTMSQSSGPLITGALAGGGQFWIAFVVAGGLKASYDVGMLRMFVNLKLEGERGARRSTLTAEQTHEGHQQFALEASDDESEMELDDLAKKPADPATDGRSKQ